MNFGFLARCDQRGVTFQQIGDAPAGAAGLLSMVADETTRAVFLGRLYYRDDLRRRLDEPHRPLPAASAAEHVLGAYRQAGVDGLAWLEGDYAFVLWDASSRRLLASRDPFGGFPLSWVRDGNAVVLSTSMRPLLDLLPRRTVNRDYLADFLILPGNGVQELHDERCAYEDIQRVTAGTRVEVHPDGKVWASRWWNWESRVEKPSSLQPEDLAARFRDLLNDSVRERRVGRTAAHLSGGMDSTAVALLAARQARAAGDEAVHGLSMVYERFAVLSQEKPYIECALGEPGLQPHRLTGEEYLSFDDFRSSINPDEPVLALWEATVTRALLELAARLGAETLMTGNGGDQLAFPLPYHLYELVRRGRWLAAWQESARWAQAHSSSRWRFLGPLGLTYFLPAALRTGLGCWRRQGRETWERQREYTIPPWVRPEFAERFQMWPRAVARLQRASHRCRPLALSMALDAIEVNVGDAIRWELGVPNGLVTVHPFFDPRLVCFSLGWQGAASPDPGRQKPILADAVRDLLPAAIRERKGKGHFNEVFFNGLSRNLPYLEA